MYLRQFDLQCYLPKPTARSGQRLSRTPYIFTDDEIKALLIATRHLSPPESLRPMTFYVLFGLLYTSGLRIGEAIALDLADVDLARQRLYIHKGKFGKSRWVPMSASTCSVLQRYIQERTRIFSAAQSSWERDVRNGLARCGRKPFRLSKTTSNDGSLPQRSVHRCFSTPPESRSLVSACATSSVNMQTRQAKHVSPSKPGKSARTRSATRQQCTYSRPVTTSA